jgi:hypothetical protein
VQFTSSSHPPSVSPLLLFFLLSSSFSGGCHCCLTFSCLALLRFFISFLFHSHKQRTGIASGMETKANNAR